MGFEELLQKADWKTEKHVAVIEILEKGEKISAHVYIGKGIPHPNTTEHHIAWMEVYFHPDGEKFPHMLGRFEFNAHGASVEGVNTSTIYTDPDVTFAFTTKKSGKIYVLSYCNIHGLWVNSEEL